MTNEQILSVLSLSENSLIDYTSISFHKNKGFSGTISSVIDADPEQVEKLVLSIFPGHALSNNDNYELSDDKSYLYKIKWLWIDGSALSVHFDKKAPAITQEPQENIHLDSTTDWTPEQILINEG